MSGVYVGFFSRYIGTCSDMMIAWAYMMQCTAAVGAVKVYPMQPCH